MTSSAPPPPPPGEETALRPVALNVYRSVPRLRWTDSEGSHDALIEEKTIVGSSPGARLVVHDPTVSRVHAELDPRADGVWIRDLGSRNGTFVEGLRVTGARVPFGGRIRLGSTELTLSGESDPKKPIELWPEDRFGQLVGGSVAMRELFARLSKIAPMNASVLVQGETGTGKELIARAIHEASPRANKPFVVVDCAALSETLLDAELFGHAKGAFTGAVAAKPGAIEAADGGTVFLDEIGELPISMQPKLLRVLEQRTVRRLGETTYRRVDVRFISATHRDLLTMVNAGEFREDLYFRLSVLPITVPPLRERNDDLERLVHHFWAACGGEAGEVSADLLKLLVSRPWRGNVRELRNFVERARALGADEALALSSTTSATSQKDPMALIDREYKDFREAWVDAGEREYFEKLLARHGRNVPAAAKQAGVNRTYIYRLIKKHGL